MRQNRLMAETKKKKSAKKKNAPKKVGCDKSQTEQRIVEVEELILSCYTHATIQTVLSEKWGVTRRQVRNYINKTYARLEADAAADKTDRSVKRRNQLEGLLELATRSRDYKAATTIMDKICRIEGTYAAAKVDITGNINVEESHKRIANMLTGIAAEREAGSVSKKPN